MSPRPSAGSQDAHEEEKEDCAPSVSRLSTLDGFLKEKGKLEEFEAIAVKEVLAWQHGEAMKAGNLSLSA